jgi:hypothetical protein
MIDDRITKVKILKWKKDKIFNTMSIKGRLYKYYYLNNNKINNSVY